MKRSFFLISFFTLFIFLYSLKIDCSVAVETGMVKSNDENDKKEVNKNSNIDNEILQEDLEIVDLEKQLQKIKMKKKKKGLMEEINKINDDIKSLDNTKNNKNKENNNNDYNINNQIAPLIDSDLTKEIKKNARRFYLRGNISLGASTNGFTGNKINFMFHLGVDAILAKQDSLFNPLVGLGMYVNIRAKKELGMDSDKYIAKDFFTLVPNEELLKYYTNYIDLSIRFGNQFQISKTSNIITYFYGGPTLMNTKCPTKNKYVYTYRYYNYEEKNKKEENRSFIGWHAGAGVDFVFLKFVMLKLDYKYIGGVNKQFNYDKTANHTFTIGIGLSFGSQFFK